MNTTTRNGKNGGREGSALFMVLLIMLGLSLTAAKLFEATMGQAFIVREAADEIRAKAIAEAGASLVLAELAADYSQRDNPALYVPKSFRGGEYDVEVRNVSSNKSVLASIGRFNGTETEVVVDFKSGEVLEASGKPAPVGAYACAIFADDDMTTNGTVPLTVGGGKIHTNARFLMTGTVDVTGNVDSCVEIDSTGNTKLLGAATAPSFKRKSPGNITTPTKGPVPMLALPDIDMSPYQRWANQNTEEYTGDQHFTGSGTLQPRGGIMWVNGNLKISGTQKLVGCFIATGTITISGSGAHTKVANYPAFVSCNSGDARAIDISGSGSINGLIYAKTGGIDITGGGAITGTLIAAGPIRTAGSFSVLAYENSTPVPPTPGAATATEDWAVWQK